MKIVVTGGIGSGKSTLIKTLKDKIPSLQCTSIDDIVNKIYMDIESLDSSITIHPDRADRLQYIKKALLSEFGTYDKKRISSIIFASDTEQSDSLRKTVESIFIPEVSLVLSSILRLNQHVLVEFPLLFELGNPSDYDVIISCVCNERVRIDRVVKRDQRSERSVLKIMSTQVSDEIRVKYSNYVVDTSLKPTFPIYVDDMIHDIQQAIVEEDRIGKQDRVPWCIKNQLARESSDASIKNFIRNKKISDGRKEQSEQIYVHSFPPAITMQTVNPPKIFTNFTFSKEEQADIARNLGPGFESVEDYIDKKPIAEEKVGLVAGSFDPITLGHTWIIKRALAIVDKVIVVIGHNPAKKFFFSEDERFGLVTATLKSELSEEERDRVSVDVLPSDELLVSYADEHNAKFIFRGIRTFTDFEYENNFNLVQKKIAPHIDILYLIPPREITEISSSLVKSVVDLREWEKIAKDYVSASVFKALDDKREKKANIETVKNTPRVTASAEEILSKLRVRVKQRKEPEFCTRMMSSDCYCEECYGRRKAE